MRPLVARTADALGESRIPRAKLGDRGLLDHHFEGTAIAVHLQRSQSRKVNYERRRLKRDRYIITKIAMPSTEALPGSGTATAN
jgi:hypothetical protein